MILLLKSSAENALFSPVLKELQISRNPAWKRVKNCGIKIYKN